MSKDLINLDSFQLPAYLQDRDITTSSSLVTQREAMPRISIKGFRFRLKKDGDEKVATAGEPLNVIVLGSSPLSGTAKSWYKDNYVSDSDDPPDCSSADGVRPDNWVDNPQCANCAMCPKNEWGSAVDKDGNETKGKACNDVKRLLVVAPNNIEKGDIYMLQVPPTSLSALSSYGRQLAKHNLPVEACVTSANFEDAEYPKLEFSLGGLLDKDSGLAAMDRAASAEVMDMIEGSGPVTQAMKERPEKEGPAEEPHGTMEVDLGANQEAAKEERETQEWEESREKEKQEWEDQQATEKATAAQRMKETGSVFKDDEVEQDVKQDASGAPWDADLHSSTQSKTKEGMWTKRRNRKSNGEAKDAGGFEQPDKPPAQDKLDTILAGKW